MQKKLIVPFSSGKAVESGSWLVKQYYSLLAFLVMAKKGSILVVDDEEVMRDVLESLLVAEGYDVALARTGE